MLLKTKKKKEVQCNRSRARAMTTVHDHYNGAVYRPPAPHWPPIYVYTVIPYTACLYDKPVALSVPVW